MRFVHFVELFLQLMPSSHVFFPIIYVTTNWLRANSSGYQDQPTLLLSLYSLLAHDCSRYHRIHITRGDRALWIVPAFIVVDGDNKPADTVQGTPELVCGRSR